MHNPLNPNTAGRVIKKVRVKVVPFSADDGIIKRVIELKGLDIVAFSRECIRVEGKLTNCENGDRVIICKQFEQPLPKLIKFGRYSGLVSRQPDDRQNTISCGKCLETGYTFKDCEND